MKAKYLTILALILAFACITSCKKELTNDGAKQSYNHESTTNYLKTVVPIDYTELCGDDVGGTLVEGASLGYPDLWDYYFFNGNAGDDISISITSINEIDAIVSGTLYSGMATTTDGITWYDGGAEMVYIQHICYWGVPDGVIVDGLKYTFNYELAETGSYTLAIMSEGGTEYLVETSGISCDTDTDGDGCPDSEDAVLNSNMEEFVVIDGCNTGVPNRMVFGEPCGTMMSDVIDVLEAGTYKNHGAFVREMAQLTEMWVEIGLITEEEKDMLMACAGQSSIGQ